MQLHRVVHGRRDELGVPRLRQELHAKDVGAVRGADAEGRPPARGYAPKHDLKEVKGSKMGGTGQHAEGEE